MPDVRLLIALALFTAGPVVAQPTTSNLEREKNWADQVVDTIVVGDAVWLNNRGHKFLGLYTPAAGKSPLAVILIHGRGVHPAWGFINRLRADLADTGVHTLSLQMPILAADAPFGSYGPTLPEAFERIDAGIRYLSQQKGVQRVVLIGHSSGAVTALGHAVRQPRGPVVGVVAISAATYPNTIDLLRPTHHLHQIRVPVLDVSGGSDIQEVSEHNAARQKAATTGKADYTAAIIVGSDHFYTDHYEQLRSQIVAWLARFRTR